MAKFSDLLGEVLREIEIDQSGENDKIIFKTNGGQIFKMYHAQDCCESVTIKEIVGDLDDLLNSVILQAEEVTKISEPGLDSETWTFYKLATAKGYVTISWYGTSNGYYSERVDFEDITREGE